MDRSPRPAGDKQQAKDDIVMAEVVPASAAPPREILLQPKLGWRAINKGQRRPIPDLQPGDCYRELDLHGSDVETLPPGLSVQFHLDLTDCARLRSLPQGLRAGTLTLTNCTVLDQLPEGLSVSFLDMNGCDQVTRWPEVAAITPGRLSMRDCTGLSELPPWLGPLAQLDLAGCFRIEELPPSLEVTSWIDIADSGIKSLPPHLAGVGIRWRSVQIDERIAFHPEEITVEEILGEINAELRRVKMERMGYERFMLAAQPEVLDRDTDAGGERKLLRVEIEDDEPLVCVAVFCPSTDRQYLLRVPPTTTTCRQGIAWTAGFDNPDDYAPHTET